MEQEGEVEHGVVIVGGGICGLATALALHRKGIESLVLERSETLRVDGAAIGLWANAWRVLDQLGVAMDLRDKAILLKEIREHWLDENISRATPVRHEFRRLLRKDVVDALAAKLTPAAIRFGCHVVAVTSDPIACHNTLHFKDGRTMTAKIVIGCDGWNSAVARYLGLPPATASGRCAIRGYTSYPDGGHGAGDHFLRLYRGRCLFGRIPMNENLVNFFFNMPAASFDLESRNDQELIRELALEEAKHLPSEIVELVQNCDVESLSMTQIAHRAPWDLVRAGNAFQRGTVTVAGDAMHVMGPFLSQGGAAAMEDAIVLARNLAQGMLNGGGVDGDPGQQFEKIGAAQREYIRERWARVMWLSTKSYLAESVLSASSPVKKLLLLAVMVVVFGGFADLRHADYDCGEL